MSSAPSSRRRTKDDVKSSSKSAASTSTSSSSSSSSSTNEARQIYQSCQQLEIDYQKSLDSLRSLLCSKPSETALKIEPTSFSRHIVSASSSASVTSIARNPSQPSSSSSPLSHRQQLQSEVSSSANARFLSQLQIEYGQTCTLRAQLSQSYSTMLLAHPVYAQSKHVEQKVWLLYYRMVDIFRSSLNGGASNSNQDDDAMKVMIKTQLFQAVLNEGWLCLFLLAEQTIMGYPQLLSTLLSSSYSSAALEALILSLPEQASPHLLIYQSNLAAYFTGLGDICRYRADFPLPVVPNPSSLSPLPLADPSASALVNVLFFEECQFLSKLKELETASSSVLEIAQAKGVIDAQLSSSLNSPSYWYHFALRFDPGNGRLHNQLALLCLPENPPTASTSSSSFQSRHHPWQVVHALHHYLRASVATRSFAAAQDNLIRCLSDHRKLYRLMQSLRADGQVWRVLQMHESRWESVIEWMATHGQAPKSQMVSSHQQHQQQQQQQQQLANQVARLSLSSSASASASSSRLQPLSSNIKLSPSSWSLLHSIAALAPSERTRLLVWLDAPAADSALQTFSVLSVLCSRLDVDSLSELLPPLLAEWSSISSSSSSSALSGGVRVLGGAKQAETEELLSSSTSCLGQVQWLRTHGCVLAVTLCSMLRMQISQLHVETNSSATVTTIVLQHTFHLLLAFLSLLLHHLQRSLNDSFSLTSLSSVSSSFSPPSAPPSSPSSSTPEWLSYLSCAVMLLSLLQGHEPTRVWLHRIHLATVKPFKPMTVESPESAPESAESDQDWLLFLRVFRKAAITLAKRQAEIQAVWSQPSSESNKSTCLASQGSTASTSVAVNVSDEVKRWNQLELSDLFPNARIPLDLNSSTSVLDFMFDLARSWTGFTRRSVSSAEIASTESPATSSAVDDHDKNIGGGNDVFDDANDLDEEQDEKQNESFEARPVLPRGMLSGVDLSSSLSSASSSSRIKSGSSAPLRQHALIVLDAANICMRYGDNKKFVTAGLALAMRWFTARGHRCLACVPDYILDFESQSRARRLRAAGLDSSSGSSGSSSNPAAKLPDNVTYLQSLKEQGLLFTTPSQDYDDSYCLEYARSHDAFLVSNDRYRDQFERITSGSERSDLRAWLKSHLVSFTFVSDEFLPNPDALRMLSTRVVLMNEDELEAAVPLPQAFDSH